MEKLQQDALISVIVPIYNVEDYLVECLESILRQTYQNLEVILVDDGSIDASGTICDEYQKKDGRIVVRHKENGGVGAARNTGLELATGDYIAFTDPDDWMEADMLEKMINVLKSRQADISFCRFHTEIIPEERRYIYKPIEKKVGNGSDAVCQMFNALAYGTMVWNKMFHRKMIYSLDGSFIKFSEELKCGEDEIWLIEVVQNAHCVAYLQEELYYWRVRDNSAYRDDKITDIKIMDIIAQEKALSLIKDNQSDAYIRVMQRLNEKVYECRVGAYINNQKEYLEKLDAFRKKYTHYWYESNRVTWRKKVKRKIIDTCISMKVCRKIVAKLSIM